ncbi:AraC family transcriptional regulator [Pedobacter sp. AW1-32]|uniref:AraC family transcriptional regulator n=1 Tax=Pedobacter sp. AW1-32 TaxID=3383026 RepID=UPI003FF105AE
MRIQYEIVKPDEGSSFRFVHRDKFEGGQEYPFHFHPEIELLCVRSGAGTRRVGNHESTFIDGDLVLIGSNVPHTTVQAETAEQEHVSIQIKPEIMEQWLTDFPEMKALAGLIEKSKHGIKFSGSVKRNITLALFKMAHFAPLDKYLGLVKVLNQLAQTEEYEYLNKDHFKKEAANRYRSRLQKLFTFVEENYHREIDIREVAALFNISVPSFCNYFKKTTNTTFTRFLNNYRVQKACLRLHEDKTIAEVCFQCGFNNVTYFNKIFKLALGKTPSDYREGK